MSVLLESDFGWIISHSKFFENLILDPSSKAIENVGAKPESLRLKPDIFEITDPFKDPTGKSRKKGQEFDKLCETAKLIKDLYEKIIQLPEAKTIFDNENTGRSNCSLKCGDDCDNDKEPVCLHKNPEESPENKRSLWPRSNSVAVNAAQKFFENVKDINWPTFHGRNPDNFSVVRGVSIGSSEQGHKFVFPPGSEFYCKDVFEMERVFTRDDDKFDLIIMDPPWWNKFIRRKKRKQFEAGYKMMENKELKKLPIKHILDEDGIIVVWCTNARSHQDAVQNLFKEWGIHLHHKLYWLKMTKSGKPVCPFNEENKKQPYESIIIGRRAAEPSSIIKTDLTVKLVMSVPSSINSHKPPLIEVIEHLFPQKVFRRKLEIFARYLVPGFTSFGNEVIKLQHTSLFVSNDDT